MSEADRARVTTYVKVDPEEAFEVFTDEIDRWWRSSPRFRFGQGKTGVLAFEEGPEGRRLVERFADGTLFEVGAVRAWEPGARTVFDWRARAFAPGEVTSVEVRFEPFDEGTRVTLEHRGWSKIRTGHPVRHGVSGQAFTDRMGLWWGELATAFRAHVAKATNGSGLDRS